MAGEAAEIAKFAALMAIAPELVQKETANGINRAAGIVKREAQRGTPWDTGTLRRSWTIDRATATQQKAVLGTNIPYAEAVEDGRGQNKPMPPPGALRGWMERKGIPLGDEFIGRTDLRGATSSTWFQNEFAVALMISRHGIPGRHMLRKAVDSTQAEVAKAYADIPANVIKALGQGKR